MRLHLVRDDGDARIEANGLARPRKGCSMYLKQIELENFKSFGGGHKLTIPLMEGYLAVTGPNGSGKSNITDAILFVLGPKSSKAIRAGKLTDLIFDGGKSKDGEKSKNAAEFTRVSLVFDNTDRLLPWDDDTVKLTRFVKKSQDGEGYSSYFYINDQKSSMTEFDSLLMRARISAEGYNMVQQGDVTRITQMSSMDRRRVLDSISGIASYDADIDKATNEKVEAENNLDRIGIIITELNTQLDQLEKDMVAARKFLEAQKQMEMAKAQMVHCQLGKAEADLTYTTEQITAHDVEVTELTEKKEKLSEKINEIEKELIAKEMEIEAKIGPEYREIKDKIESVKIDMATIRDRMERSVDDIQEQEQIISEYSGMLKEVESELQDSTSSLVETESQLKERSDALDLVKKDHEKLRKDISSAGGEITVLQTKMIDTEDLIDKKSAEEHQAGIKVAQAETAVEEASQSLSSLEEQINEADFEIKDAEWNIKETKEAGGIVDTKEMADRILAAKKKEAELEKQENELSSAVNRLSLDYERLRTEKRVTESMGAGSVAVSAILALRDKGALKGIHGTVAELGSVDPEWETALGVAAGGRMQNIVVDDDQVAADAIEYLKREKLPRATFLPMNKMMDGKPRAKAIMIEKDVVGYAVDLIRFEPQYKAVFWNVLGDTLVVETLDQARRLMGGVRLVTKVGEVLEASGAMTGGTLAKQNAMKFGAASETQMEKVGAELRAATDALEVLRSQMRDIRGQVRILDDEFRKVSTDTAGVQGKMGKLEAELNVLKENRKRLSASVDAKRTQMAEAQRELDQAQNTLNKLSKELEDLRNEKTSLRERVTEMAPADIQERLQNVQDSIFDLESDVNRLTTEKATLNAEKTGIEGQKDAIVKQIETAKKKIAEYQELVSTADGKIAEIKVELDGLKKIESDMESTIADMRDAKDAILKNKYETENKKNSVMEKIDTKRNFALTLEAKVAIIQGTIDQLKAEIALIEMEVEMPIPSEQELTRVIRSCEGIMAKAGNVNLRAIEDYDERKERHTRLSDEVSQLKGRIKELVDLMTSLNEEKTKLFMTTYEGVESNFREIYADLSGGGEALMKLENPESPFEGGLQINAKPRNGKLLRLEALSGGEKSLTALAFIFAIQEYQPSPLYVLDEVDMFLDSVNAEMVAKRVKKSSAKAQFIQVSLRNVALAVADHLYGVTRQTNGISKVIIQPDLAEVSKYEGEALREQEKRQKEESKTEKEEDGI